MTGTYNSLWLQVVCLYRWGTWHWTWDKDRPARNQTGCHRRRRFSRSFRIHRADALPQSPASQARRENHLIPRCPIAARPIRGSLFQWTGILRYSRCIIPSSCGDQYQSDSSQITQDCCPSAFERSLGASRLKWTLRSDFYFVRFIEFIEIVNCLGAGSIQRIESSVS